MADRREGSGGTRAPWIGWSAAARVGALLGGAMCLVGVETALYSPFAFARPLFGIALLVTGLALMLGGGFLLVQAFQPSVARDRPPPRC